MRGQTYIILACFFALIVAVFAVINVDPVEVNFLFGTGNAPLILVILISVLMGVLITASVGIVRLIKLQREIRNLKRENSQLKEAQSTNEIPEITTDEQPESKLDSERETKE